MGSVVQHGFVRRAKFLDNPIQEQNRQPLPCCGLLLYPFPVVKQNLRIWKGMVSGRVFAAGN